MQVFITRALRAALLAGGLLVAGAGAAHAADDGTLPGAAAVVQVEAAPDGTALLTTLAGTPGAGASGTDAELQAVVTIGSVAPVAAPDPGSERAVVDLTAGPTDPTLAVALDPTGGAPTGGAPTGGAATDRAVVTVTGAREADAAVAPSVTAELAAVPASGTAFIALGAPGDSAAGAVRVGANRMGSAPEVGSLLVEAALGTTGLGSTGPGMTGLGMTEVVDQGSSARESGLLSSLEPVGASQVGAVTSAGAATVVGGTESAAAMQVGAASNSASGRQLVSGAASALPAALAFTGTEPRAATLLALLLIAAGLKARSRGAAGVLLR